MVRDLGFSSPVAVGWVMAGVYAVGAAGMILNGMSSDRTSESRLHCGIAATVGGAGLIGLALLGTSGSVLALACLVAAVAGARREEHPAGQDHERRGDGPAEPSRRSWSS